jgi:hypothetical protein
MLAMRDDLARNPAAVDRVLDALGAGQVTDPIAQIIVPMKAMIAAAPEVAPPTGTPQQRPAAPTGPRVVRLLVQKPLEWQTMSSNEPKLPRTVSIIGVLHNGGSRYELQFTATLVRPIMPQGKWPMAGTYSLTVPTETCTNTAGRDPITFYDAGRQFTVDFGYQPPTESKE